MRGEYAAIHSAIVDDPDFKALSVEAKTCFYTLRMLLGASGIDLVRASETVLEDLTGMEPPRLRKALNELVRDRWLIVQRDVLWLRNALKYNPNINLKNENHRKAALKHLAGLPQLEIVNAFAVKYGIEPPFPDIPLEWDTEWYRDTIPDPVTGHRSPVTGGTTTTAAAPPEEVESSKVEIPAYGDSELLDLANTLLGKGTLPGLDQMANKRILLKWLYEDGRDRGIVYSAIEGAAAMRDSDLIGWDSAKPGSPMTLKALNGPMTLADQGDGQAKRMLFDVAAEHARRALPPPKARKRVQGDGLKRVQVDVSQERAS